MTITVTISDQLELAGIGAAGARSHAKLRGWQVFEAEDATDIATLINDLAHELAP